MAPLVGCPLFQCLGGCEDNQLKRTQKKRGRRQNYVQINHQNKKEAHQGNAESKETLFTQFLMISNCFVFNHRKNIYPWMVAGRK